MSPKEFADNMQLATEGKLKKIVRTVKDDKVEEKEEDVDTEGLMKQTLRELGFGGGIDVLENPKPKEKEPPPAIRPTAHR